MIRYGQVAIDYDEVRREVQRGRGGMWVTYAPSDEQMLALMIRWLQSRASEWRHGEGVYLGQDPLGTGIEDERVGLGCQPEENGLYVNPWDGAITSVMPEEWYGHEEARTTGPSIKMNHYLEPEHRAIHYASTMRGHAYRKEAMELMERWVPGKLETDLEIQLARDVLDEVRTEYCATVLFEDMGWTWEEAARAVRQTGTVSGMVNRPLAKAARRPARWPSWSGPDPEHPEDVIQRCWATQRRHVVVSTIREPKLLRA